ncbi:MAG: phosphoribosylformylglycinamidine synthase subunit PurL [Candidatus Micrarchaeota archaeon]|nr:phosphoribosylformylglycinamidine synthase subunit PurL [Candidatus Micrarchaeota archaeon]
MLYKRSDFPFELYFIKIREAADSDLKRISSERCLSLSLVEMRRVREHYRKLARDATDVELEMIAQIWSEHCCHKTLTGNFKDSKGKTIATKLLKNTIMKATKELNLPWCKLVFKDNAGIVDFDGKHALAFKVETHNHPSALEPFGGASTGVGGVIRDILGVWADPIANTDVLCFAPLDFPEKKIPKGIKSPPYLYNGVVAGIGAYGNNMGIPTVNGSIHFDESYLGNPLVYCGCLGLLPMGKFIKNTKPKECILLAGGRTGKDGIHGVTFASAELTETSEESSRSAVQIGDPIEEEKLKRAILRVRDEGLASAVTDLGGGGVSCAVSEMAERSGCGATVELETVPLKYPINAPWEIWVSESQERMLLSVSEANLERTLEVFEDEDVEATVIGRFNDSRQIVVLYKDTPVANLSTNFLYESPSATTVIRKPRTKFKEPNFKQPKNLGEILLKLLSLPGTASKESVIHTYDHEVKGHTVIKPLQGAFVDGPGDAAVLKPLPDSWKGVVLSNGFNPQYGKIDCYAMAASAIDEAIRNNIAVGGRRIALLDNFCWGSPNRPELAYGLVEACKACRDMSLAFKTPFISGKDSLYNESAGKPITPSLLISAVGIMPDVRKAVTMDAKKPESLIYLIGETRRELGGSSYYSLFKQLGVSVPQVNPEKAKKVFSKVTSAIDKGLLLSCHDLSEGGLGVAAAEMAFSGDMGMELDLQQLSSKERGDFLLFSESNSRFLVEVAPSKQRSFERLMKGAPFCKIGRTTKLKEFVIEKGGKVLIAEQLEKLRKTWQEPLK